MIKRKSIARKILRRQPSVKGVGDLGDILKRIDKRMAVTGWRSDRALSLATGLSGDLIRSMRKQWAQGRQRGVMFSSLEALAGPLKTNPFWLLNAEGDENEMRRTQTELPVSKGARTPSRTPVTIPTERDSSAPPGLTVVGIVAAGAWRESSALASGDMLDPQVPAHPRYPLNRQFALQVSGDSINKVAHSGDYVIALKDRSPISGNFVIIERVRHGFYEASVKQYIEMDGRTEYRYASNSLEYNDKALVVGEQDGDEVKIHGVVIGVFRPLV